jgi:hypothetical protein
MYHCFPLQLKLAHSLRHAEIAVWSAHYAVLQSANLSLNRLAISNSSLLHVAVGKKTVLRFSCE